MKISTALKCVLLTMLVPLVTVRAQSVVYSGALSSPSVTLRNMVDGTSISFPVISAGEQVSVDATGLTVSFQKFEFKTQSFTASKTVNVTVGFGVTQNFNISMTFNALTFVQSDPIASHALSGASGGSYDVLNAGSTGVINSSVQTFSFTGGYTVMGPTQTSSGTFNVTADTTYVIVPKTINTNNYPNSLTLSNSFNSFNSVVGFQPNDFQNFVSTTVDGQLITWGFSRVDLVGQFGTVTPGALATSAIPEPSTYAAIFSLTALGFAAYRRKKNSV